MIHAKESYNRIQDPENKIAEDEPVFLIRAQDKLAPFIVTKWAELLMEKGGDPDLALQATSHAIKMYQWQQKNGCKLPD